MISPKRKPAGRRWQVRLQVGIGLIVAGLFIQLWLIDGLFNPCYVVGSSMANCLLGDHCELVCEECGCPFCCDATSEPRAARAICPNCGRAVSALGTAPRIGADRVWIDRTAFVCRQPARWDVVAFRRPQRADELAVKRIVGLPGEKIEIRYGDIFADDRIVRKSFAEQKARAILVYDAAYMPIHESAPPPRWRPAQPNSQWDSEDGLFSHPASSTAEQSVDWLVYHHQRRGADGVSVHETPITDLSSYDPAFTRREEDVSAVVDVMLSFQVEVEADGGPLWVRISDGIEEFRVELALDPQKSHCQAMLNDEPIPDSSVDWTMRGRRQHVVVSVIDQQLLVAINGTTLLSWPYERPEKASSPSPSPVAIGVVNTGVTISQLRLYRDVYYTKSAYLPNKPMCLAEDEYYILGDNSPVSEDSRTWPEPSSINRKCLLGKVLTAISAVPPLGTSPLFFQVPNLGGIRYIR